jgi:hypothetical protein
MTSLSPNEVAGPMKLRVCDGEGERIMAASIPAVEQVFARAVSVPPGTEISLTDGEQILVALALGTPESNPGSQTAEFLLSRVNGEYATLSGPIPRGEALRRFREFVLAAVPGKAEQGRRVTL